MARTSVRVSRRIIAQGSEIHGAVQITHLTDISSEPNLPKTPVSKRIRSSRVTPKKEAPKSVEIEYDDADTLKEEKSVTDENLPLSPSSSRPSTPRKASLLKPHPAPKRWEKQLAAIKEMRYKILPPAPVDTMGCDSLPEGVVVPPVVARYQTLTALMLSSQTKDPVTAAAMQRLREGLPGGLTVQSVLMASPQLINECICKVGFHNRKTIYIKQTAEILRDEYDHDIPHSVDELCRLPGVGPKMAYLTMQAAWSVNAGIGVDTHVHRITNRLGWHKPSTKEAELTRVNLESWLPQSEWKEINWLLVGFGQLVCQPIGPKCNSCILAESLCPSASVRRAPLFFEQIQTMEEDAIHEGHSAIIKIEDIKLENF